MAKMVYTIGHSTHDIDHFVEILKHHVVTAVADVRSSPYSRFNPQYNREDLLEGLRRHDIQYVFLGKELGARSSDPRCYVDGRASYELIARSELFQQGLQRVLKGIETFKLALMCAEKDPLECHRTILVARRLIERGADVHHILADSSIENHDQTMARLVKKLRITPEDMLRSKEQVIEDAYRIQGNATAYQEHDTDSGHVLPAKRAGGTTG